MGIIAFYEGNNGTQNLVQTVEDTPGQSFRPVRNDIRSAKLYNTRPGSVIHIFESPNGSPDKNFCIVDVKRMSPEYIVDRFNRSYEDEYVRVTYMRTGGAELDGNVARIKID